MEHLCDQVRAHGVHSAPLADLIAIGLARDEADANDNEDLARKVLRRFDRLHRLGDMHTAVLKDLTGLDPFEILRVQALVEIGRRTAGAGKGTVVSIDKPEGVVKALEYLRNMKKEHFVAVLLDVKKQIMRIATVHIGTLDQSMVGMREVYREAVLEGAASLIVAHNHPSGDPTPSEDDLAVTRRLLKAGDLLDIDLVDHIVIGNPGYVSLRLTTDLWRGR